MKNKVMVATFLAFASVGCAPALAYQCFPMGIPNADDFNFVKGKELSRAINAPMFKNETDFDKWISEAGKGLDHGHLIVGHVLAMDRVVALEDRSNVCGYSDAGWVHNSRLGRVFIYIADF